MKDPKLLEKVNGGKIVYTAPRPNPHSCKLPKPNDCSLIVGDRWRCDCGQLWEYSRTNGIPPYWMECEKVK